MKDTTTDESRFVFFVEAPDLNTVKTMQDIYTPLLIKAFEDYLDPFLDAT